MHEHGSYADYSYDTLREVERTCRQAHAQAQTEFDRREAAFKRAQVLLASSCYALDTDRLAAELALASFLLGDA